MIFPTKAVLTLAALACVRVSLCDGQPAKERKPTTSLDPPTKQVTKQLRLGVPRLFEKAVTRNVRLSADGTAIELDQGELFEDDGPAAGYSYKPNQERLSETTWIKKVFLIPHPRAAKATLLVGSRGKLRFIVNGKNLNLQNAGRAGNYWQAYLLPPNSLKSGKNEIIVYGSGTIWIARDDEFAAGSRIRTKHPNRSAKSTDGGKTWTYDKLGTKGNADGEYYVRLFLDRFRPAGSLTLSVVDVGNFSGQAVSPPLTTIGPIHVKVQAEAGKAEQTFVRVRSGTTAAPNAKSWSDWQKLGPRGGTIQKPKGRYVQVSIQLTTRDPLQTPKLKKVVIEANPKHSAGWTDKLQVLTSQNEAIVRTSIPFKYEPFDHPRLKLLRQKYKLDGVVQGAKSEFGLITKLAAWSAQQWQRGHLGKNYPPWDAIEILKLHKDGTPVGGFCQQYNLVFLQACESFGLSGRAVSLGPGGLVNKPRRGGHEVVEIWSNDYKRWVYVDGDNAWYAVDHKTGVPLSLWELRQRQLLTLAKKPTQRTRFVHIASTHRQRKWTSLDQGVPFGELRLIPRSNFLQTKSPLPLNQGMRGWFWTGHYVWTDRELPAAMLYGNRVGNRNNWEWTLNQTHVTLEAMKSPGHLRVHLDTETPGFKMFVANIDGRGNQPVASGLLWQLQPGKNRLEVWSQNITGRKGVASSIDLEYTGYTKGVDP